MREAGGHMHGVCHERKGGELARELLSEQEKVRE